MNSNSNSLSSIEIDCKESSIEPQERVRRLCLMSSSVTVDDSVPIKRYWRSGKEMIRMANIYREEQYLDKAFILYMKYITLFVEKIVQHSEYAKCDANEKSITKTNCKNIFPIAEELKSKLLTKYQKEYDLWLNKKKRKEVEIEEKLSKLRKDSDQIRADEEEKRIAELQSKLDKQIGERKEKNLLIQPNNQTLESINSDLDLGIDYYSKDFDSLPRVDRSTKPSTKPSLLSFNDKSDSLRRVIIPKSLVEKFLFISKRNTDLNCETCAILAGKFSRNEFTLTHLIVPKQTSTANTCFTDKEEEVFAVQDKYELISLGWVHTHPTQTSFMSSMDLHCQCGYQLMLPEAIAIVCAPKFDQIGIYSLTDPYGIQFITNCKQIGFHPHPNDPPIYHESSHVVFDDTIQLNLIDLR